MKKISLSILSLLLVFLMLFNITGCNDLTAGNLTDGLSRGTADSKMPDDAFKTVQLDFAADLFKLCAAESDYENTLISPISVMTALAMTANGAGGLTEEEMEAVLGGGMSTEDLNAYLYAYLENLSDEVSLANSIWFKENGFDVKIDTATVEAAIDKVMEENAQAVADFKNGKEKAKQAIFGACMRALKNTADANVIRELLDKKLSQ